MDTRHEVVQGAVKVARPWRHAPPTVKLLAVPCDNYDSLSLTISRSIDALDHVPSNFAMLGAWHKHSQAIGMSWPFQEMCQASLRLSDDEETRRTASER